MSDYWDIADEDITIVIASHKAKASLDAARAALNEDRIVASLRQFTDFADQVAAASSEIEDQLMAAGVIPMLPKKFEAPVLSAVS